MSLSENLQKCLTALYLCVDKSVADDINKIVKEEVNNYQEKAESWDKLGGRIEAFYEQPDEKSEEEGGLIAIGEMAAEAFGYL